LNHADASKANIAPLALRNVSGIDMPETPIPVDFNNADEDEAVRLVTRGTLDFLRANAIELFEGMDVTITDGEILADAVVTMRHGAWVAVVGRWDYV
jgi:hypothetical protein